MSNRGIECSGRAGVAPANQICEIGKPKCVHARATSSSSVDKETYLNAKVLKKSVCRINSKGEKETNPVHWNGERNVNVFFLILLFVRRRLITNQKTQEWSISDSKAGCVTGPTVIRLHGRLQQVQAQLEYPQVPRICWRGIICGNREHWTRIS